MPVLWQSSQRPMYVRTIWVDGFRHALLTHDDPYYLTLRRPLSSTSTTNKHSPRDIDEYFKQINLVVTSDKSAIVRKPRPKTCQELRIEKLNLSHVDLENDEFFLKANPDIDSARFENIGNMKTVRSNRTARTDATENTELSERVLQWLDLAGKIDLLAPEKAERMTQPRHSWPEIQRRNLTKSKTVTDIRDTRNSAKTSDSKQESGTIDRHDYYVPTSANTIENYARQSRNARGTPRNDKLRDNNKSRVNVVETRQKMASERSAVEKQYAELVSKRIIPDINKKTKKQVHIFMPALQRKLGSNVTSRAESLLSSKT